MQELNGYLFHDPLADVETPVRGLQAQFGKKSPDRTRKLGTRERALREVAKDLREMQRRKGYSMIAVTPLTARKD